MNYTLKGTEMTPEEARKRIARMGVSVGPPTMTREQCEAKEPYPHNQRCRFTTGFYCEDCGTWIPQEDERWYFTNKYGDRQDR